ncbi:Na+/H+ antiporter subunit E [Xylophilus rhododendri]|uniref:Na+/H+ antiporter subunit E n=1 Tax=Xylophilus rhododendri TaxID=2697032 RepID=A0A857J9P6_9BURK|nr:Na+/H+ antiporter subunit E [Xylophilus rhododendri]QHI99943.1 Na+/H+ antiporter subunit E [Xylophilus rhododendri]
MRKLLPAPLLSLALALLWLVLWDEHGPVVWLGAIAVGLAVPVLTAGLRPSRPHARRPLLALALLWRVTVDATRSCLEVAWLLLTRRAGDIPSGFLRVPLLLQDSHALATLAVIVSAVPGTALAELAADRSALLLHVFDTRDNERLLAHIRLHYEQPLREIFET